MYYLASTGSFTKKVCFQQHQLALHSKGKSLPFSICPLNPLPCYLVKSLTPIFEEHISKTAQIVTDKWRGFLPLKKVYDIEQKLSNNGKNFKELHIVIIQLKSWLRAIPTHVSKWHVQAYFNEFCFRINRSQFKQSIFHKTIERMVKANPIYHRNIKQILSM